MKNVSRLLCIYAAITLWWTLCSAVKAQTSTSITYQVFYDNLSPYGKWIQDASLGYVWVPTSQQGFRPYFSNGYWVMTEYGSTWVSTYPWGWATFHYGRWTHDDFYGWLWVPGTEWGPSWVVWRSGGNYYGWAPMQPGYRTTAAISPDVYTPPDWWVFIPRTALLSSSFARSYKGPSNNVAILKSAGIITNTDVNNGVLYVTGPHASEFARATNQHPAIYSIHNSSVPAKMVVSKSEITIYRPTVIINNTANKPTPASFAKAEHPLGKASAISAGGNAQHASPSKGATKKGKHHFPKG